MGVKNLNILINLYKNHQNVVPKTFYLAVVDGNNMLITFLQSAIKNLNYGMDIIEQVEDIITNVYERVIKEFDKFVRTYKMKEIWVVFDPRKKLEYNFDMNTFDLIDIDHFKQKYNSDVFTLASKESEHNKRERSRMYSEKDFSNLSEKELYGLRNQRIANRLIKMLQKTLVNASRFTNGCGWLDEEHDCLSKSIVMSEQYKLFVVQGEHTEADLIIKNLVESFNILYPNEQFLIISKDTDYKILFANRDNVWCSELNCNRSDIISPYITWKNFFKPLTDIRPIDIYKAVIRIAPLIGNDYTAGYSSIISLRNTADMNLPILKLFDKNINTTINLRTNIGKFLIRYHYDKTLDENVKLFDSELYNVYIESVAIYNNWLFFGNDYNINTKHIDFDENLKLIYNIILSPEFGTTMKAHNDNEFVQMFYDVRKRKHESMDDYFDDIDDETQSVPTQSEHPNTSLVVDEFDGYFDD